jgi:hypothetical protein
VIVILTYVIFVSVCLCVCFFYFYIRLHLLRSTLSHLTTCFSPKDHTTWLHCMYSSETCANCLCFIKVASVVAEFLFQLKRGRVCNCHIITNCVSSLSYDEELVACFCLYVVFHCNNSRFSLLLTFLR